jgi:putative Mn2+ efflux pump MntP
VFLAPQLLLVGAVVAVGILHTLVPDHWVPISLMARQSQWSRRQTARAALLAGTGHALSTLAIGLVVWIAGAALATRYGHFVSWLSSIALIAFGAWIAIASLREVRHGHRDEGGTRDRPGARMTLLLILGSSPMIEGIPLFFAAARFGVGWLAIMAFCFGLSTIATYVVLCVQSGAALQRLSLGALERYGEVLSGAIISIVGVVFLIWPLG